jgi:hypothetical protein
VRDALRAQLLEASAAYTRRDLQTAGDRLAELLTEVQAHSGKALPTQAAGGLEALTHKVARMLGIPLARAGRG